MTSYCPTIGQLNVYWSAIGNLVCVLTCHWSFVLYEVIFIDTIKSFTNVIWPSIKMRFLFSAFLNGVLNGVKFFSDCHIPWRWFYGYNICV